MQNKQQLFRNEVISLIRLIKYHAFSTGSLKNSRELAKVVGITPAQLSRISTGVCSPSLSVLFRLLYLRKSQGYDVGSFIRFFMELVSDECPSL